MAIGEQAEGDGVDGDGEGVDAAVAEDELAESGVAAAEDQAHVARVPRQREARAGGTERAGRVGLVVDRAIPRRVAAEGGGGWLFHRRRRHVAGGRLEGA